MVNSEDLCMSCMHETGGEKKCPHCGFHVDTVQSPPCLPIRTLVGSRYIVGKELDRNGEGITYIGWDIVDKKAVNIREFNPTELATRTEKSLNLQVLLGSEANFAELRRRFEDMWTKLIGINESSAMINATKMVDDYGTSYAIYDHFDGISLRDFLLRSKTGYIAWDKARQLLMPTLTAIESIHKAGVIHAGISPATLVIGEDGKLKITGFSIPEARCLGSLITPRIFDGYASIEQYHPEDPIGPWTDIYAFAAVLYRALIGSEPVPAKEREANDTLMVPGKFAEALPAYVINALINGLQINPKDRTKNAEQFRAELSASPAATASGVEYQRKAREKAAAQNPPKPVKKKELSPAATIALTSGIIALVGLAVFFTLAFTVFKDKLNINIGGRETTSVTETAEPAAVPNFVGRSYYDIESNPVFNNNFRIKKEEIYSLDVNAGYVISQNIDPDTLVPKGSEITLYVSKGKEKIVLPDVTGADYQEALTRLTELGFEVVKTETSLGNYKDGEVIMMSLTENQKYDIGTKVTLKVYVAATTEAATQNEPQIYTRSSTTTSIVPPEDTLPDITEAPADDTAATVGE